MIRYICFPGALAFYDLLRPTLNFMHVPIVDNNLIDREVLVDDVQVEVLEVLAVRLHLARSNFMLGGTSIARPRVTLQ